MITKLHRRAIGVFSGREAAGQAIDQLMFSGFPIEKVFLVGQEETIGGVVCAGNRRTVLQDQVGTITGTALGLKKGLFVGNLVGSLTGFCLGLGVLTLPGVGAMMFGSAIVFTCLGSGLCTAAGGVIGALIGLGLTEKQAKSYSDRIARGDFLVIVDGTTDEIHRAISVLNAQGVQVSLFGI